MAKNFTPEIEIYDHLDDEKANVIYTEVNENLNSAISSLKNIRAKAITIIGFAFLSASFLSLRLIDILLQPETSNISAYIATFSICGILTNIIIGSYLVLTCFMPLKVPLSGSTPSIIIKKTYLEQNANTYKVLLASAKEEKIRATVKSCSSIGNHISKSIILLFLLYLVSMAIASCHPLQIS